MFSPPNAAKFHAINAPCSRIVESHASHVSLHHRFRHTRLFRLRPVISHQSPLASSSTRRRFDPDKRCPALLPRTTEHGPRDTGHTAEQSPLVFSSLNSELSAFFQLTLGGKKTPQKLGDGDVNSTGTIAPSCVTCGGRTTLTSTLACVLGFSTTTLVFSAIGSGRTSIAPLALTVCVWPSRGWGLPTTWTTTRIFSSARCARRRSSAVGGREATTLWVGAGGFTLECGFTAQAPRNPSPVRLTRPRTPNRRGAARPSTRRWPHWRCP